jgi:cell division protein ZapA (FtsZ GTPase activity inhibitor)
MKQKYTISIADVQLNVVADGDPERIEYIVGVIDRKMREILLKSKSCPKTQAALLCALDLCSDKLAAKDEIESLKMQVEELSEELRRAQDNYDRAQRANLSLEKEKARLEIQNAKLLAAIQAAGISLDTEEESEEAAVAPAQPVNEEQPAAKKDSRSRVGSMFDLLTFSDI